MIYKTTTLDTFVTLQRGFDLPAQDRIPGDVPVIAANGPVGFHNIAKVHDRCVVIGRSGSVGNPQLITDPFWPLNTTLFVKDFHGNSPTFVYYVLKTIDFKSFDAGGTVPTLNRNHLTQIEVPLIDLAHQESIGRILQNLDLKIAANNSLAKTLEVIAQTIFKSWFIDFDPVKAKLAGEIPAGMDAKTVDLFPDSMEVSENGLIPKGWHIASIGDISNINGGKMLSREDFNDDGMFPIFGGAGVMGKTNKSNADGFVITVGRVGAYCGQFFYHRGSAWVNNNASRIIPQENISGEWMFQFLKSFDIESIKKGAAQPFVSNSDLSNSKLLVPPFEVIQRFTEVVRPMFEQSETVRHQARLLAKLRDSLLPRLISGELQIPDEMLAS